MKVQFYFRICTFVVLFCISLRQSRLDTFTRCEKYSSKLDMFSLAYSYLCKRNGHYHNLHYVKYEILQ